MKENVLFTTNLVLVMRTSTQFTHEMTSCSQADIFTLMRLNTFLSSDYVKAQYLLIHAWKNIHHTTTKG